MYEIISSEYANALSYMLYIYTLTHRYIHTCVFLTLACFLLFSIHKEKVLISVYYSAFRGRRQL